MKHNLISLLLISMLFINACYLQAKVWHVGATQIYVKPGSVQSSVSNGDTIYIDGGIYANDAVKWTKKNLHFIGLGNSVNPTILQYSGDIPNQKGIWVFEQPGVSDNPYIENITFDGAQVSDAAGGNGAGIRFQSVNITINRCKFKHCQNGILEGGSYTGSNVIIENSEFAYNGYNGSQSSLYGYEHQMYISAQIDNLIVRNCYIHDVRGQGHSLKTRAQRSYILYNMIDEAAGNGSYEIDIAQGGMVVAIGNVIIQGTSDANHTIICLEAITNPLEELYFINNTIINKYPGNVKFMATIPSSGINVFKFYNNIFASVPSASNTIFSNNIPAVIDTTKNIFIKNYSVFGFVNPDGNNFNLISSATSAIDKGAVCGFAGTGYSLTPAFMYKRDSSQLSPRTIIGSAIDIGAFEYDGNVGIGQIYNDYFHHSSVVFPNPFNNSTIISLKSCITENVNIELYDMTGKCNMILSVYAHNGNIQFNRNDLKTGLYYYNIMNSKFKTIGHGKMMVM